MTILNKKRDWKTVLFHLFFGTRIRVNDATFSENKNCWYLFAYWKSIPVPLIIRQ